jgi:CheY-like chemotaxis protein
VKPIEESTSSNRGIVLYVEDDDDTRNATCALLTLDGYDVRAAATPEAAFAHAAECHDRIDLLIVDYNLRAAKTGTEVAETISRLLGHGIPTVILTGDPANAEVPWLKDSAVWLTPKPISPAKLVACLSPLVDFRRVMRDFAAS